MKWTIIDIEGKKILVENKRGRCKLVTLKNTENYKIGESIQLYDIKSIRYKLVLSKLLIILLSSVLGIGGYYIANSIVSVDVRSMYPHNSSKGNVVNTMMIVEPSKKQENKGQKDTHKETEKKQIKKDDATYNIPKLAHPIQKTFTQSDIHKRVEEEVYNHNLQ